MKEYLETLKYIKDNGEIQIDRTAVGTKSIFGHQMRFDLTKGFPAVTTKKLAWKAVVGELLWFLEGSTDERRLAEITYGRTRKELTDKKTIWTANANFQAKDLGHQNDDLFKELGPVYGYQWRNFDGSEDKKGTDQIKWIIKEIKNNPGSRRIILSAWNPNQLDQMALPPCHTLAQFRVINRKLNCQLYQRSADMFLGVPFNIASYSLLTHMIAQICDIKVGEFVWTGGDCHIYLNHIEQVKIQLKRKPKQSPTLLMPKFKSLDELHKTKVDDYKLINYEFDETIKAEMAV